MVASMLILSLLACSPACPEGSDSQLVESRDDSTLDSAAGTSDSSPGPQRGGDICGEWSGIPDDSKAVWVYQSESSKIDYLSQTSDLDRETGLGSMTGPGNLSDPSDPVPSLFVRTRQFRCDAEGVWLTSDFAVVTRLDAGDQWEEGVNCHLTQPLLIPRDPKLGDAWTGQCHGSEARYQGSSTEYDCTFSFTVTSDAQVSTQGGSWEVLTVEVVPNGTCGLMYPITSFSLARGAGIVAMAASEEPPLYEQSAGTAYKLVSYQ